MEAAKKLNLNIVILGRHVNKDIKLECPHYYFENQEKVFDYLNQSNFYVDSSEFEGFGMTPIEAAYLNKITIEGIYVIIVAEFAYIMVLYILFPDVFCTRHFQIYEKGLVCPKVYRQWAFKKEKNFQI